MLAPPGGRVRSPAEYEENEGILIRWGALNAVLTELVVAVSQHSRQSRVWIVVADAAQEASARSSLVAAGADPARLLFLHAPSNSIWIRDYGPRFIGVDGRRAIVDHVYNRPRPLDDADPPGGGGGLRRAALRVAAGARRRQLPSLGGPVGAPDRAHPRREPRQHRRRHRRRLRRLPGTRGGHHPGPARRATTAPSTSTCGCCRSRKPARSSGSTRRARAAGCRGR
ncbi:MAG: agmatine deiminase family protein [Xanthomonadales bacterium]|nr:agmatine deiminase family protein [Xanthomonadales bacterium]